MNKKNVLMLGPGAPNRFNSGLGIAANEIAEFLHNVVNLTVIQVEDLNQIEAIENNTSSSLNSISKFSDFEVMSDIASINIESTMSHYWYDQNTSRNPNENKGESTLYKELETLTEQMESVANDISFDTIYAHDWMTFLAAIELKKKYKKPLILHVHSLDYDRSGRKTDSWVYQLEKDAFQHADKVICVSNYSKGILESEYGVDLEKIQVIHNGYRKLTYPEKKNPFKEKVVLFVGRLTGQKGATKFLEIAESVHEKYPNSRFIMAGDGDLYASMIQSGAHSPIADKFHLTGFLNEPELLKAYSMADVYCMPSVSEPFGLTALEAAGAGLPIVLSENSGASEVLPNALSADFNDTDAFVNHIVSILKDEKLASKLGSANKLIAENLGWEKPCEQILKIITEN
jgi:glycogen synthase